MSAEKCIFCGVDIPEGRQICPVCEHEIKPFKDIIKATLDHTPVEYNGEKYGCISAFTIRTRASHLTALKKRRFIAQVEIMSGRTHNVIIAAPKDIKILEDWRPPNE